MMVVPTSLNRNIDDEMIHAIKWAVSRRYLPVEKLTALCNDPDVATMIAAQ